MLPIYLALLSDPNKADLFDDIVKKYENRLYWVINGILNNHHDSEEALQDAFISIARNIHKISDITSDDTQGYIYMAAKSAALNKFNREVKKNAHENIDDFFSISASDDIIKNLETKEITEKVLELVNSLSEPNQILFFMHYMMKESIADIAKNNGEKPDTVKTRFVRLNKILRNYIKENFK